MEASKYLSVGALTRYLKMRFDTDDNLRLVFLKGEISNFKSHSSGHFYFSLKDETSKINAIMFSRNAQKLSFLPTDGMKVLVTGRVSVYESTGNYQIYIEDMMEDGVGNLYIAFEQLKEQLSKEGLFRPEHKKRIPRIPEKIGIVTAPTGAAVRDIISTVRRRFPLAQTILFPSLVQGENAKEDIVKNIKNAEKYDLDVLIVGRGGGSIEDLWAFNEEIVARAIYDCSIPVISAVGHEVDYTISDFVADLRAPTPTGAAELAVPNITDLMKYFEQLKIRLNEVMSKKIHIAKTILERYQNSYILKNPMAIYDIQTQKLDMFKERLNQSYYHYMENQCLKLKHLKESHIFLYPENLYKEKKVRLKHFIEQLELLNPLNVLKRGYTITYQNEKIVNSISDITEQTLSIHFIDGIVKTKIIEKKENIDGKEEKI